MECALLRTAVSFTAPIIAEAIVTGRERPRLGNRAAYVGPSDLYRCRDGCVYVTAATQRMWCSLMALIGRPDLVNAPSLLTDEERFECRSEIDPLVAQWMADRTTQEALVELDRAHIAAAVYRTTSEVLHDPQVKALDMLHYLDLGQPGL